MQPFNNINASFQMFLCKFAVFFVTEQMACKFLSYPGPTDQLNWASALHNGNLQKSIIFEYFLRVGRENANRAVRSEGPLDQAAHEKAFVKVCKDFRVQADMLIFTQSAVPQPAAAKTSSSSQNKKPSSRKKGGGAKKQSSTTTSKEKWPTYQGLGVCFAFNSTKADVKCTNTEHEKGCEGVNRKGECTTFAHVCAEWLGESKGHCLGPHPRKEHK